MTGTDTLDDAVDSSISSDGVSGRLEDEGDAQPEANPKPTRWQRAKNWWQSKKPKQEAAAVTPPSSPQEQPLVLSSAPPLTGEVDTHVSTRSSTTSEVNDQSESASGTQSEARQEPINNADVAPANTLANPKPTIRQRFQAWWQSKKPKQEAAAVTPLSPQEQPLVLSSALPLTGETDVHVDVSSSRSSDEVSGQPAADQIKSLEDERATASDSNVADDDSDRRQETRETLLEDAIGGSTSSESSMRDDDDEISEDYFEADPSTLQDDVTVANNEEGVREIERAHIPMSSDGVESVESTQEVASTPKRFTRTQKILILAGVTTAVVLGAAAVAAAIVFSGGLAAIPLGATVIAGLGGGLTGSLAAFGIMAAGFLLGAGIFGAIGYGIKKLIDRKSVHVDVSSKPVTGMDSASIVAALSASPQQSGQPLANLGSMARPVACSLARSESGSGSPRMFSRQTSGRTMPSTVVPANTMASPRPQ